MARSSGCVLAALLAGRCVRVLAIDNGLGITPPRGWRSWNLFHGDVNATVMQAQMRAVLDKSRAVRGKPMSLAELGFDWVSMDDGWQKCNCSFGEPTCTANDCRAGRCSWHDKATGSPVVDAQKFPSMKGLVDYGHSLGLKVGSYLNNCICMEGGDPPMGAHCTSPTHYEQDVEFILSTGFDGVKIDNCGSSHNVSRYAELFNSSGKPIRIESCHTFHPNHHTPSSWPNFPVWDPAEHAKDVSCPMNFYRTGGDVSPNFASVIGEMYATVQYADRPDPFSHPGCWAYPDMHEIGNFHGPDPLRTDEERTHWGLWCIASSPLILGFDMSRAETMDRVWATIANPDALAVNDAWAGNPGTLIKSYPASGDVPFTVDQAPCDGRPESVGWRIQGGLLVAPGALPDGAAVCLSSDQGPVGQNMGIMSCPPPTRHMNHSGCGLLILNCSQERVVVPESVYEGGQLVVSNGTSGSIVGDMQDGSFRVAFDSRADGGTGPVSLLPSAFTKVEGTWEYSAASGEVSWRQRGGAPAKCLGANLPRPVGGFYGGPVAATTALGGCPRGAPATTFNFTDKGELRAGTGMCLVARKLYGAQLWSKPLPGGKAAVLVVNLAAATIRFSLPLADIPSLGCEGRCAVRDVWAQRDLGTQVGHVDMELRVHESAFYVLGPPAPEVARDTVVVV